MTATLGFFTQHELDPLVGYRRRRERMEGKALPVGARVKAFSQQPIIFPEFAVLGLVLDQTTVGAVVRASADQLYRSGHFRALSSVVKRAVHGRTGWTLDDIASALLDNAADDLLAWRAQIAAVQVELAERDIKMRFDVGRIEEVTAAGYVLSLAGSDEVVRCALNATRARLPVGIWVTRDIIESGAHRGEVLVPTVELDILRRMGEKQDISDNDEHDWDEMFSKLDFQPVSVPHLREMAAVDESGGDLMRPKRRIRVNASRDLYANANSMARDSRPHAAR
ncbi:MAG: hypothetical protein M3417_08810 [Actinomycetota bacterium]|nr:hypothetical protein [Actinomycetota bacterium]